MITIRTTCRSCGGLFDPLLNLGSPVLSDFVWPTDPDPARVPLDLVCCQTCQLVQLRHTVDPNSLFLKYWYKSSINEIMRAELADVVQTVKRYCVKPVPTVMDIGANDGTLLGCYPETYIRIAVEPAQNLEVGHASQVLREFFPAATKYVDDHTIDAITSIAMFYDLDDPTAFVAEVDRLLTPHGVWILQFQDLLQQLQTTAFDNIVAEHLCYYGLRDIDRLLAPFNLGVIAVIPRPINGGSLRFVILRTGRDADLSVPVQRHRERDGLTRDKLDHFAWRVGQYKDQLLQTLDRIQSEGHTIDLYAASTKSSTLLQCCGIDHQRIRCAVERTPEKVGRVTSGTRIPIIAEEDWRVDPAPVTLLGAWQHTDFFVTRETAYLDRGGAFLVPLPSPRLIYGRHD